MTNTQFFEHLFLLGFLHRIFEFPPKLLCILFGNPKIFHRALMVVPKKPASDDRICCWSENGCPFCVVSFANFKNFGL
jgi:hypothetical protein